MDLAKWRIERTDNINSEGPFVFFNLLNTENSWGFFVLFFCFFPNNMLTSGPLRKLYIWSGGKRNHFSHSSKEKLTTQEYIVSSSYLLVFSFSCKRSLHWIARQKRVNQPQAFITKRQMVELVTYLQKLFMERKKNSREQIILMCVYVF